MLKRILMASLLVLTAQVTAPIAGIESQAYGAISGPAKTVRKKAAKKVQQKVSNTVAFVQTIPLRTKRAIRYYRFLMQDTVGDYVVWAECVASDDCPAPQDDDDDEGRL